MASKSRKTPSLEEVSQQLAELRAQMDVMAAQLGITATVAKSATVPKIQSEPGRSAAGTTAAVAVPSRPPPWETKTEDDVPQKAGTAEPFIGTAEPLMGQDSTASRSRSLHYLLGDVPTRKSAAPAGKVKASFNLRQDEIDLLRAMAERLGTTVTSVLQRAISDEGFIQDQLAEGNRFAIVDRQGAIREIIWR
jgi:hypothetical protein